MGEEEQTGGSAGHAQINRVDALRRPRFRMAPDAASFYPP